MLKGTARLRKANGDACQVMRKPRVQFVENSGRIMLSHRFMGPKDHKYQRPTYTILRRGQDDVIIGAGSMGVEKATKVRLSRQRCP